MHLVIDSFYLVHVIDQPINLRILIFLLQELFSFLYLHVNNNDSFRDHNSGLAD